MIYSRIRTCIVFMRLMFIFGSVSIFFLGAYFGHVVDVKTWSTIFVILC